jgi:hypothetical protein
MKLTEQQEKFLEFVKEQHSTQVRKYTGEPYWTHPLAVAELVDEYKSDSFSNGDLFTIEISLGHDLLEDTSCTVETLRKKLSEIGYPYLNAEIIVSGIRHLTDTYTKEAYPKLNRAKRKAMEAERLGEIPSNCQTVKYADLIENLSSIVEHDKSFAVTYLQEKKELLKNMRGGKFDLYLRAVEVYLEALKTLEREKAFDEIPYCPKCESCGVDGCCSPMSCFNQLVKDKNCRYGKSYLLDVKFSLELSDALIGLIDDGTDLALKSQYEKIYSKIYTKIYTNDNN